MRQQTQTRRRAPGPELLFALWALAWVAGVGAYFYVEGWKRTGGMWPVPLDDVYIHFLFAKSTAQGSPFQWVSGNGYSSGNTSVIYPLLLAPGHWLGFRGAWMGLWAAGLAVVALVDLSRSLRRLIVLTGGDVTISWLVPPLLMSIPVLDWSWFSGMESAVLGAVLGRALVAAECAGQATPANRARGQWFAAGWVTMLVATRPEMAPLAGLLLMGVVYRSGSMPAWRSTLRTFGPLLIWLGGYALANRMLTGEWSAAGAVRKLLFTNPYATPAENAGHIVQNLTLLRTQGLDVELGGRMVSWLPIGLLGLAGLLRGARALALPIAFGALGSLLLVSLNSTAQYQNLRYLVPVWVLLLCGASLGLGRWAALGRTQLLLAGVVGGVLIAAPSSRFERQREHFAMSSKNIAEQQVAVGKRIGALRPRPRSVFVGDAGAIPFFAETGAIDGLGLGGYHELPFARASVHGLPAIVELLERLPPDERPDLLAIYPSWFPGLEEFGTRRFSVAIDDNVICGAPEKVVFDAHWSMLDAPRPVTEAVVDLDVGDLVDERRYGFSFPQPHGGWIVGRGLPIEGDVSERRYEGGRIIASGSSASFEIVATDAPAQVWLRLDDGAAITLTLQLVQGSTTTWEEQWPISAREAPKFYEVSRALGSLAGGGRLVITPAGGPLRVFHIWVAPMG